MFGILIDFFSSPLGQSILPTLQGSFMAAYPANAPFPIDIMGK